jgi:large conductance mechanosensitive channel
MGLLGEFKEFAVKGNMIDMAIGIVIGAAFGTVVKSLVDDVIMPPIGLALGKVDFSELAIELQAANPAAGVEAVTLNYGNFINNILSLLIVAAALFMVIKIINRLKREEAAKPTVPPAPPEELVVLREIRDQLKKG